MAANAVWPAFSAPRFAPPVASPWSVESARMAAVLPPGSASILPAAFTAACARRRAPPWPSNSPPFMSFARPISWPWWRRRKTCWRTTAARISNTTSTALPGWPWWAARAATSRRRPRWTSRAICPEGGLRKWDESLRRHLLSPGRGNPGVHRPGGHPAQRHARHYLSGALLFRHGPALFSAGGAVPGGPGGDHLCRGHHGAVPLHRHDAGDPPGGAAFGLVPAPMAARRGLGRPQSGGPGPDYLCIRRGPVPAVG